MFIESGDWHEWQPSRNDEFAYLKMERDTLFMISFHNNLRNANFQKTNVCFLTFQEWFPSARHFSHKAAIVQKFATLLSHFLVNNGKTLDPVHTLEIFASADPKFTGSPVSQFHKEVREKKRNKSSNFLKQKLHAMTTYCPKFPGFFSWAMERAKKSLIRLASHAQWVLIL